MAVRSGVIGREAGIVTRAYKTRQALAALPAGSVTAVFEGRTAAVGTAVQLMLDLGPEAVWVATGVKAAAAVRQARSARPFLSRMAGAISDEEALAAAIVKRAEAGATIVVVNPKGAFESSRFDEARHIVQFGRWTVKAVR